MLFMPQYKGSDGTWSDVWFAPTDYSRAKSIRNMFLRENTPRKNLRILAVV